MGISADKVQIISRSTSADIRVSALLAGAEWLRTTVRQEWYWQCGDGGKRPESYLSLL